jgi:hypothetical protein
VRALKRYWPSGGELILAIPTPVADVCSREPLPPTFTQVTLPEWASDVGVDGALLVPEHFVADRSYPAFEQTDWLGAAFWYLNGTAEREFESLKGPIHSYSFRLKGWDPRMWERAWANRIALLLRRWAARRAGANESAMFGCLPQAEIMLTHDVDATHKTWSLRAKQTTFHGLNAIRAIARGNVRQSLRKLGAAARFAVGGGELPGLQELAALEHRHGMRGQFFVYGASRSALSLKLKLIDPAYDCADPPIASVLRRLGSDGHDIGLHQSYDSWRDPRRMIEEKSRLEKSSGTSARACRQHWLRFSWAETWEAQQTAGFTLDATLGFNDRPGFRNGAALRFRPSTHDEKSELAIDSVPMVLMDSHLYDYAALTHEQRVDRIHHWIREVKVVAGVASVLWHPHTLGDDYGWRAGFETLLECLDATHTRRTDIKCAPLTESTW